MAQNIWTHVSTKRFPVDIIRPQETTKAIVDFPKRFPTTFQPVSLSMKDIKCKLGETDFCYVEPYEINAHRQVTQKQIEMISQKFQGSRFTISVPFHFQTRESAYLFFSLRNCNDRIKMQFLDGHLSADQWILDKNGINLSMKQLIKYQDILNDSRKRNKPTQQEIYDLYDENGQFR